ncbi:MAG: DNRLRE domain-containing protein [Anaerolineales bacterium]|nr:DNRLRE domain-containing protein [Anaerolineales bacterium]
MPGKQITLFELLIGLAAAFCGLMLFAAPVAAQDDLVEPASPASPAATSVVLRPSQDVYVDASERTVNFNGAPDLFVSQPLDSNVIRNTLVQFDLSGIPRGSTILNAELAMYQTKATGVSVDVSTIGAAWDEKTVTWATAPFATFYDNWTAPVTTDIYLTKDVTKLVQQWVDAPANNYGLQMRVPTADFGGQRQFDSSDKSGGNPPLLRIRYQLPPIRVCIEVIDLCLEPAVGAEVVNRSTGAVFVTDKEGYLPAAAAIELGDALWARYATGKGLQNTLYDTSGDVEIVDVDDFFVHEDSRLPEMRIAVTPLRPLMLFDLVASSQRYYQDDRAAARALRTNLIKASDLLYDFTDGQFALGTVTVKEFYIDWEDADIKLHNSNTFHPNANPGGIVPVETPDISATVGITYTPGSVYIGSYWNRFGTPPNQENTYKGIVVPEAALVNDWAIALAHELSHFLLFMFDTYTDANGVSDETIAELCTGSAMGNAYPESNHAFIFDQAFWDSNCALTEAYARLLGRTEWDTIQGWYGFPIKPVTVVTGQTPPVPLTSVVFELAATPPQPLASQLFTLTYQAGETSSGEARAFLIRDDNRVLEQGKPAKDTTQVALTDARVNDQLCVYDVNDHAETTDTPRNQFGCEVIAAGDDVLVMTRNRFWAPFTSITQTGDNQLTIEVTQPIAQPGVGLMGRLFPEHGLALNPFSFTKDSAGKWQAVVNLADPVGPVYLQLWVDESPAAPKTRREVMADRGVGGNGAFGPARLHGGVMVVSSDSNATYHNDAQLELEPGQSIAWQSMPGTPQVLPWERISGQSYRLDAFPPSLVDGGEVSIVYHDAFGVMGAIDAAEAGPRVHFWDGQKWIPLKTTVAAPAGARDGLRIATAPSRGVGPYAVLAEGTPGLFMPLLER